MNIFVNGQPQQIESTISLETLLTVLGYQNKKIAVELNEEIVPARLYAQTLIKQNDSLEIVHAIGGG